MYTSIPSVNRLHNSFPVCSWNACIALKDSNKQCKVDSPPILFRVRSRKLTMLTNHLALTILQLYLHSSTARAPWSVHPIAGHGNHCRSKAGCSLRDRCVSKLHLLQVSNISLSKAGYSQFSRAGMIGKEYSQVEAIYYNDSNATIFGHTECTSSQWPSIFGLELDHFRKWCRENNPTSDKFECAAIGFVSGAVMIVTDSDPRQGPKCYRSIIRSSNDKLFSGPLILDGMKAQKAATQRCIRTFR